MSGSWFSFARLSAILAKEFIQMRRDRVTFAMMLVVPLMQLLLFGFGFAINNDPKSLPSALDATSNDHYTRARRDFGSGNNRLLSFRPYGAQRGGGRSAHILCIVFCNAGASTIPPHT